MPLPSLRRTFLALLALVLPAAADLTVHTDFESGSARVLAIDQGTRTIRFMPAGDPSRGWPCWWFLRVDGLEPGSVVRFELVPSDRPLVQPGPTAGKPLAFSWAAARQAALSHDGTAWRQTEPGRLEGAQMTYEVTAEGGSVWLAWGPPFTTKDREALLAALPESWTRFELARTREGGAVSGVSIGAGENRPLVWIQARQHAWESGGSWTGSGFLEWLAGPEPLAAWLRAHAEVVVIPIMDVDHVASGDGGKDALPQDHNRDWSATPHWPEVAAAQARLRAAGRRLAIFIDLHNPAANDRTFFFSSPGDLLTPTAAERQQAFLEDARAEFTGPLPFDGKPRESGAAYHPLWQQISKNWVHAEVNPDCISLTLENAWNTPESHMSGYRENGAHLGRIVARHLQRFFAP